jgi:putative membrane protein
MFVDYRGSLLGIIGWQWKSLLVLCAFSAAATWLGMWSGFKLPALPLAVVGGAVGIFVSFRTNSAYQRWWEGRQLWGRLINNSRLWATQVLTLVEGADAERRRMVLRQVLYTHVLRCLLRNQKPADDVAVRRFLGDDAAALDCNNPTHWLLHKQSEELAALSRDGKIDGHRLQLLGGTVGQLLDVQGGCERIKKTPFPRGYGFISERLVYALAFLMPLGLHGDVKWISVPLTVLVCAAFVLIGEVGRVLEDPFTMFWPALPLSALSTTIEIDLRQRLGDTDVPAPAVQDKKGILM